MLIVVQSGRVHEIEDMKSYGDILICKSISGEYRYKADSNVHFALPYGDDCTISVHYSEMFI